MLESDPVVELNEDADVNYDGGMQSPFAKCSENFVQGQNGNFKIFSKLLFYCEIIN